MPNFRIILQYDGTRYNGYQRLADTDNTIQGKIEDVLARMVPDQDPPVHLISAGRTDAGVHALGQTANVHLDTALSPDEIRNYLNRYLPEDIGVVSLTPADPRFHARLLAVGKTYTYRIAIRPEMHVLERRCMTPLADFSQRLLNTSAPDVFDLTAVRQTADLLLGTHDFAGFCSRKTKKSTIRTVSAIELLELPGELQIRITGDGFLYNMVRIIVGTLMEAAFHLRRPDSVSEILELHQRCLGGMTAPAKGLLLQAVYYPGDTDIPGYDRLLQRQK